MSLLPLPLGISFDYYLSLFALKAVQIPDHNSHFVCANDKTNALLLIRGLSINFVCAYKQINAILMGKLMYIPDESESGMSE